MLAPAPRAAISRSVGSDIAEARPVGGGCISPAWRVRLEDGRMLFVKTAPSGAPPRLLRSEAYSLERLASASAVRVPSVVGVGEEWLALEWLEPASPTPGGWRELGCALARLHRRGCDEYGWAEPNFIGTLPQSNERIAEWPEFWRSQRLLPQIELAKDALDALTLRRFDALVERLDDVLGPAAEDGPSLLHGDLWNGNVHFTEGGAVLIDPSSSCGHREVDLAMAALFGGFPESFFTAYDAEWPLLANAARRRPIYQLYYVLVHVNLFGGAYVGQTRALVERALA